MQATKDHESRHRQSEVRRDEENLCDFPQGSNPGLAEVSKSAEEKIKTAEDAIAKALSGDSTKFLESFVQEGGE